MKGRNEYGERKEKDQSSITIRESLKWRGGCANSHAQGRGRLNPMYCGHSALIVFPLDDDDL